MMSLIEITHKGPSALQQKSLLGLDGKSRPGGGDIETYDCF